MSLLTLESSALAELATKVREEYADLKAKGLKLDLTRGKPSKAQLTQLLHALQVAVVA